MGVVGVKGLSGSLCRGASGVTDEGAPQKKVC